MPLPDPAPARTGLSLAVGSFVDARDPLERTGVHPPLELRWFGLVRRGQNWTGDAAFLGAPAAAARADLVRTLERAGLFRAVRPIEADAGGEDAWAAGSDLLLSARLESLVGIQQQDQLVSVGLVGWFRNRLGAAEGVARLHVQLHDRAGIRFDRTLEGRHAGREQTISEAARDALAMANEAVASELFRELVPPGQRYQRRVPLVTLDGCGLGPGRTRRLLDAVNEIFEREVGLHFDVRLRSHPGGSSSDDLEAALGRFERAPEYPGRLVLAILPVTASEHLDWVDARLGLARQLGDTAVVRCVPEEELRVATIAHELAHLFGAVHVHERTSLLHPALDFDARFLDSLNRRILRTTLERPLAGPLPQPMARELRAIYRAAARFPGEVVGQDLEAALRGLDAR